MVDFKPVLDQRPNNRPAGDWSHRRIMALKAEPVKVIRPPVWDNPNAKIVCKRDQGFRGTCTGFSTAYCFDIFHLTLVPGDKPTAEDIAQFKMDVIDSLGTTRDILFPQSSTAEGFYQRGRQILGITYPEGGETRGTAMAWVKGGAGLEKQWHTDKTGKCVWQDDPRKTTDGGLSKEEYDTFAFTHRAEGWAFLGDTTGTSNFDEICDAIFQRGFVLAAIPVYENYGDMAGGDGSFPEARGNIAGYHALCFYGYDENNIHLLHSWGTYCSTYGSASKQYITHALQESVYLVVLDTSDVAIARDAYKSLTITVKAKDTGLQIPADVKINGIQIGLSPIKISTEPGKLYAIEVSFMGYQSQKKLADDSSEEIIFELDADPAPAPEVKGWFQRLIEFIKKLLGWN